MNISRSIRIAKRQITKENDGELELDESQLEEERLKNLLTTNKRKLNRPRDVFNNIQEDVPKLRRSVVARALQTYVCSTPMPTEKQREFFDTENSLNISSISSNSEKLELVQQEHNNEQANKRNSEDKICSKKEINVILTKGPILISDSSDEENVEAHEVIKNKTERKNVNIENDTQTRIPYNTRSLDKTIKQTLERENIRNNHESQIPATELYSVPSVHQNTAQSQERGTSNDLSREVSSKSNIRVSKRSYRSRKNVLCNRKRIDVNSTKKQISPNHTNCNESNLKESISPKVTRSSRSRTKSPAQSGSELKKKIESEQTESPSRNYLKKNRESLSKSPSNNRNQRMPNGIDLKENKLPIHKSKVNITQRKTRNLSRSSDSREEVSKSYTEIGISPQKLLKLTRKSDEQSLMEINTYKNNSAKRPLSSKNNVIMNTEVEIQKELFPRKLFIQIDDDTEERNNLNIVNIKTKESKKTDTKIKQSMENPSKIPVLRSRSKSNDKSVEKNLRNRITFEEPIQQNECPENTYTDTNYKNAKENVDRSEIYISSPESPPKRPVRKKKDQRRKNQIHSENIVDHPEIYRNISTITVDKVDNVGKFTKQLENNCISEKNIVQNGASPNKLEIPNEQILKDISSSHNALKNMMISENALVETGISTNRYVCEDIAKETAKSGNELVKANTCNLDQTAAGSSSMHFEKEPIPAKTYVEKGTSPLIFENVIETVGLENNVVYSKNSERTLKNNNEVFVECDKNPNLERALIEIGTSPIRFTGNNDILEKTLTRADTSPENVNIGRTSPGDSNKTEKLNQLLLKISRKFLDSPNIPSSQQIKVDSRALIKTNHTLHKQIQTSAKRPSEYSSPSRGHHREVQTSLKSQRKRTPYRRNFCRNIFTQTVLEQQTQTTNSLIKTNKSYKNNKRIQKNFVNGNKSDSSTDQSEILREVETSVLFQSLKDVMEIPNFSSSDDDIFENTLCSNNLQDLPWRLDDDLLPQPRRSYKLNFIRSAGEIEIEKKANSKLYENCSSDDSYSELEGRKLEKKKSDQNKKNNMPSYSRKNKLKRYSRANVQNKEKISCSPKLGSQIHIEDKERSSSPQSAMSDLHLTESIIRNLHQCQEKIHEANNASSPLSHNDEENTSLDAQPIEKNINEQGKEFIKAVNVNEDICELPANMSVSNMRSLVVRIDNNLDLVMNENNLNKENVESTPISKIKNVARQDFNTRSKFTKKCNTDRTQNTNEFENDEEILATPLEDTEISQLHNTNDVNEKPEDTQIQHSKEILAKHTVKPNFKVPKGQARKSKKKIVSESDGGVSSTTIDDTELNGVRRSGRERKPQQRRFYGIIAAHSEREINYYNGSFQRTDVTINSSRQSTKKRSTVKKNQKGSAKKEPRTKGRSAGKKKVKDQIEEEEPETSNLADESNKSKKHPVDVLINEVDIITNEGHNDVDKSKTNRRKKHHDDISSTTDNVFNRELSITPKRNKISNKNKSHSSANLKRSARLLRNRTQKDNVTSTSHNFVMPENDENSTNIEIDNNPIPDKCILNSNITNTNYTSDGMSQDDMNHFSVKIATEHTEDTTDFVSHISVPRENSISLGENKIVDKSLDKDSGRSTMLRTTTYNDSNLPTSKRLTGRIHKKYKKRDNVSNKISKVLSRSIYNSGEYEILNGNEPNMVDSGSVVQTSLTQPIDSEYINLLFDNEVHTMKYVEKKSNFKLVNDLMVTDILKNSKDGGAMGYLKLPPGSQKPLHIARKFALFYFVIEGEAFIQVHNKASKIGKYSHFMIPLGIEYSINNLSKEDSLTLGFVRMPPICES